MDFICFDGFPGVQLSQQERKEDKLLDKELVSVNIYTDGACSGNPGAGGYGVVIIEGNKRKEFSQGYRLTTNNRMELLAAIIGLQNLSGHRQVRLFTDSRYISDAINLGWLATWRAKGWRKTGKGKVLNPDLWKQLAQALDRHTVEVVWLRGHAGHEENERCDFLAVQASRAKHLLEDVGYLDSQETEQPGLF